MEICCCCHVSRFDDAMILPCHDSALAMLRDTLRHFDAPALLMAADADMLPL